MIKTDEPLSVTLAPPRFEDRKTMSFVGLNARYDNNDGNPAMAEQWKRFMPYLGTIPGEIAGTTYGILHDSDAEGTDYLCAVEVAELTAAPKELTQLRVPAQHYAVYSHLDHVSKVRETWKAIRSQWGPASGIEILKAPAFERYGRSFDPASGIGGLEIWVPIKKQ